MDINGDSGSPVPEEGQGKSGAASRAAIRGLVFVLTLAQLACPIQRPLLPESYLGFRYDVELAVRDTALAILRERPADRRRLERRLTELSSLAIVDSLVSRLRSDPRLSDLGSAVDAALEARLSMDGVGGDVRKAYKTPPGQRLAADAILVGLGRAIYLSKEEDRQ